MACSSTAVSTSWPFRYCSIWFIRASYMKESLPLSTKCWYTCCFQVTRASLKSCYIIAELNKLERAYHANGKHAISLCNMLIPSPVPIEAAKQLIETCSCRRISSPSESVYMEELIVRQRVQFLSRVQLAYHQPGTVIGIRRMTYLRNWSAIIRV